jgi:hypothetical protein
MTSSKGFDCVEMKHRGAERVLAEIEGMTPEQELEYWRQATESLRQAQRERLARPAMQPEVTRHP